MTGDFSSVTEDEESEFQDAVLWVLEDNSAARAFYKATGWKFDKRDPSYRDFNAACIRYRRLL